MLNQRSSGTLVEKLSFQELGSVKTPYPVQKLLKSVLVLFSPLKDLKVCLTFDFIVGFQRIL